MDMMKKFFNCLFSYTRIVIITIVLIFAAEYSTGECVSS